MLKKNNIAASVCLLLLIGCSNQETADDLIVKANTHLADGKPSAAIIELKNALQLSPDAKVARLKLGETYLLTGSVVEAEKELKKALDLGADQASTLPALAKAHLMLGKTEEVIELVNHFDSPTLPGAARTSLLASGVIAALVSEDEESADAYYSALKAAGTNNAPDGVLAEAYIKAFAGQDQAAFELVDTALAEGVESPFANLLKGQLATKADKNRHAADAYGQLVNNYPLIRSYRLLLIEALLRGSDTETAKGHIEQLLKLNPKDGRANLLKAIVAFKEKSYENASTHAELALTNGYRTKRARFLAGLSAYKLQKPEQAYQHLAPLTNELPADHIANRIVLEIDLARGILEGTAARLQTLGAQPQVDTDLLTFASRQYLAANDLDNATYFSEKAVALNPNDAQARVMRGVAKLSNQDLDGISDLEEALQIDPNLGSARIALAYQYLQRKQHTKATEVAQQWISDAPEEPAAHALLGMIYSTTDNLDLAQKHYGETLSLDPDNLNALLGLAKLAATKGPRTEQFANLSKALTAHPASNMASNALLAYMQTADDAVKVQQLAKSLRQNQSHSNLLITEALAMQFSGSLAESIQLLESVPLTDRSANHHLLLGDSYLKARDVRNAEKTFQYWREQEPANKLVLLRMISTLEIKREYESALRVADEALSMHPDDIYFTLAKANLLYVSKDVRAAKAITTRLSNRGDPMPAFFDKLSGLISMAEGNYESGTKHLHQYHEQTSTMQSASLLASAYQTGGQLTQAIEILSDYLANQESAAIRLQLASLYAAAGRDQEAIAAYERVLAENANQFIALNNLATLQMKHGLLEQALNNATKAQALQPENPATLDTYGFAQLLSGNTDTAATSLKKAHSALPANAEIRVHYAAALAELGDLEQAVKLIAEVDPTEQSKDISALITSIRNQKQTN